MEGGASALACIDDELLALLRAELSGPEQRTFLESFASFLQHDQARDFVISLDDAAEWAGFSRKDPAKAVVVKRLDEGKHYRIFQRSLDNSGRGRPTEDIRLTVDGFKRLCLKADTAKADRVHDYYLAMDA